MRRANLAVFLLIASLVHAEAQMHMTPLALSRAVPAPLPDGAEARQARLLSKLGPQSRAWISQEARREAAAGTVSQGAAAAAAQNDFPQLGAMAGEDIMALAFLVLMEAAKQSEQDLKDIMAATQKANEQKKAQRGQVAQAAGSLDEMSEEQSLKLQMAMDRRSKAVAALSNMMKKSAAANDNILQNLK